MRIRKAIGENKKKKIIPKTIGLTIFPSKKPNLIHNLFSGRSNSGLITVIMIVIKNNIENIHADKNWALSA